MNYEDEMVTIETPKGIRTIYIYVSMYDESELSISLKKEEPSTYSYKILVAELVLDFDKFNFPNEEKWVEMKYAHRVKCAEARIEAAIVEKVKANESLKDLLAIAAPTKEEDNE